MSFSPVPRVLVFILWALLTQNLSAQNTKENADFKLAINLYNDGLYDLAAEQLRQFIVSYPGSGQGIEARFYLGLTQLKLKQYDDARLTFQTFALTYQDNPKAPDAWWNVGESYAAVKNYREAALAYERVKVFHPKSKTAPLALVEASKYFHLVGETDNARRVLRIVLQEYAASNAVLAARTQLGKIYFEEGQLDLAQTELKRVVDGDPAAEARAQAMLTLGSIYQATGKSDQAQALYQEILTKHKSGPVVDGAYLNLGKLEAASSRYLEAVARFKKVLDAKPDSSLAQEALVETGDAYASLGDYSNATAFYERFIDSFPHNGLVPSLLWKSAIAGSEGKNYRKSNDACNRLLKSTAPSSLKRRAMLKLARNAEEQKTPSQAVQFYAAFLEQYSDDPATDAVLFRIASVHERDLLDFRKAASYYDLITTRFPRSPLVDDAYFRAGGCFEQLKEFGRALQLYRHIVDALPSSEYRPEVEKRIVKITTFEVKDKDAGLEKLALLIGDVVAERDRVGLAFKLGEIYFNDLKNYSAAAAQFSTAINSGMTDRRFVDALYMRAKSYEILTMNDEGYRSRAIESYKTFLQSYPAESRSYDAGFALFSLSATSVATARQAYTEAISAIPNHPRRDMMLLRIGELEAAAGSSPQAIATFTSLIKEFRDSPAAEEAQFRIMQAYVKSAAVDSAMAAGSRYLNTFPSGRHTAEVLAYVAGVSMQNGNAQRAADLYLKLADDFGYTDVARDARQKLVEAHLAGNNYGAALSILTELYEQQSNNPLDEQGVESSVYLALAKAHHMAGNGTEAKKHLFRFLARKPSGEQAGDAFTLLGMIYRSEGSVELATSYFRQAGVVSPATAASREVADLLFNSGNYADAIKQYTQLSQSARTDADRQYFDAKIILSRLRSDDLTGAEKLIVEFERKYRDTDEDLGAFELEKGNYYFRRRDYTTARRLYDRVESKYDNTAAAPVAMYWIGKIIEATGKAQDAIRQFEQLMKEYPKAPIVQRAHFALGNIYYTAEKWDESIQNYRRVVDDPKADQSLLPFALSNLIETYEAAGVFDAALSATRKYLDLFPNNEDSFDKRIKIGILYNRLGYNEQAVEHLQGLLDQAGPDLEGELRYYIAEANYSRGDYQQAILDFLKVPYLVTKKGKIDWTANSLYMSGQSYEKMGRYDQALTMYQQIVDRPGIDEMFKTAARKEIDRVKLVLKRNSN